MLLACVELLKTAPKIITFLPDPPFGCLKLPVASKPIPYQKYFYLSISELFVNLTARNRQFCKVTLESLVVGINL